MVKRLEIDVDIPANGLDWRIPKPTGGMNLESTTLNGYRIRYQSGCPTRGAGETQYTFNVVGPLGVATICTVVLPDYIPELVRAETGREHLPAGRRFWEAMCEETLSNYLWQNAAVPVSGLLRVTELTPDLERWISAVIAALTQAKQE